MSRDDDMLGENFEAELRRLVPSLPASLEAREGDFLNTAHAQMRQTGRRMRWGIWAAGSLAAAAALAVGVTLWQVRREPAVAPVAAIQQHRPTIVDAMIAARRGARPAEVDQIAMAAVRLEVAQ